MERENDFFGAKKTLNTIGFFNPGNIKNLNCNLLGINGGVILVHSMRLNLYLSGSQVKEFLLNKFR
jgi:hypothetical protein